jgi:sortase A
LEDAPAPAAGDIVGRIRIPRVGIDLAVFEGVTADVLRKGPGHVPGTALPTSGSNCVITAHRDSFFRRLADVQVGDAVFLSGEGVEREYRLASRRVVAPSEVGVLAPSDEEQLTLVTCYPFRWIGPAPERVVWQALPIASFAKRPEDLPAFESR